jgi:hypothetical protein
MIQEMLVDEFGLEVLAKYLGIPIHAIQVNCDYLLPRGSKITIISKENEKLTYFGDKVDVRRAVVCGYSNREETDDIIWLQEQDIALPL